jgi:hypothetical protein
VAYASQFRLALGQRGAYQLRQLGDVGGDAPGLVAGEEMRRRAASRLLLEIDAGQRLQLASRMFWVAISP